jgi:hypothetical protein
MRSFDMKLAIFSLRFWMTILLAVIFQQISIAKAADTTGNTVPAMSVKVLPENIFLTDGQTVPVSYGKVAQDAARPTKTFVITNTGGKKSKLKLIDVVIPDHFRSVGFEQRELLAGEKFSFQIEMKTGQVGTFSGPVKIQTNLTSSPFKFPVSGTVDVVSVPKASIAVTDSAGAAILSGQSAAIDFGAATQNSTAVRQTFFVKNNGTADLTHGAIALPTGFVLVQDFAVVAPAQSSSFIIQMNTQSAGSFSGEISFSTNDPQVSTFHFPIVGRVLTPPAAIVRDAAGIEIVSNASTQINFGDIVAGSAAVTKAFTLSNNGQATLTTGAVSVPAGFQLIGTIPAALSAGQSASFSIQMDSASIGVKSGLFSFATNDSTKNPYVFSLSGAVLAPGKIAILDQGIELANSSQTAVQFGTAIQGTAALSKTFTIQNRGGSSLSLGALNLPAGFSRVGSLPAALAAGESASLVVQLSTATVGDAAGLFSLSSSDASNSPFVFTLSGRIVRPAQISIWDGAVELANSAANAIDFGSVVQGTTGQTKTFTIKNVGGSPLSITSTDLPSGFTLISSAATLVAPGDQTTLVIQANTSAVGNFSGPLSIGSNDTAANPFVITLKGVVLGLPQIAVTMGATAIPNQSTLDFGNVVQGASSPIQTFTVTNVGGSSLNLGTISVDAPFILTKSLGSTLAAGASDTFNLKFDSSAAPASYFGNFSFSTNDSNNNPFHLSLAGSITAAAHLTVLDGSNVIQNGQTTAIDFGSIMQNGAAPFKTFTFRNDGGTLLSISNVNVPAGFTITKALGGTINPGSSDYLIVQLDTATIGTPAGSVTFDSTDSANAHFQFPIKGTVTAPSLCPPNDPSKGLALVFKDGVMDWNTFQFKNPVEVCVGNLGVYDDTGTQIATNGGLLNGRWGKAESLSIDQIFPDLAYLGPVPQLSSDINDFRVDYTGATQNDVRAGVLQSAVANKYYFIDDYRTRFLNDAFVDSLNLPAQIAKNLKYLQYRPDLQSNPAATLAKPKFRVDEIGQADGLVRLPIPNIYRSTVRTRADIANFASLPPLALSYDGEIIVSDYAALASFWVSGFNTLWPMSMPDWRTNMAAAVSDGISHWAAYRYSGHSELYKYFAYAIRTWAGVPCGGTNVPCEKGSQIRNVMMVDVQNSSADGVFPYSLPTGYVAGQGPSDLDLSSLFIGAIFYDIANEAGLGIYKTDQLAWKLLTLINDPNNFTFQAFGQKIQEAARALWPMPGNPNRSIYEDDIVDVLTSRGVPMNGVADFRQLLPAAISPVVTPSSNNFGSSHPEVQPGVNFYGNFSTFQNGYVHADTSASYVAYKFYKHSKYGPCDKLALTDGTFTVNSASPFNWSYNNDGTFYTELTDRELGNLVLLAPGRTIRWMRSRQRCSNEATGSYDEDVRSFGFRVTQAISNGFSFSSSLISADSTSKTYALQIVDPSVAALGDAQYTWTVTDFQGAQNIRTGNSIQITVPIDQPVTITIVRSRGTGSDSLTFRERGSDLNRNGGNALVRNLIP